MTQYIKFVMSKGSDITVDEPQARNILKSPQQIHPVVDAKGVWTHETINKAFMVETVPDHEKTRSEAERERMMQKKLDAPPLTKEQIDANMKRMDDIRRRLRKKMNWA